MNFIYKVINYFLIITLALFFVSCAAPINGINENIVINTQLISNYLNKANDFLLLIIFLLKSNKYYWQNIYSRLYYFYFTLARIKSILQQRKILKNNHDEIWKLNKKKPKQIFGKDFKKIRVASDYEIINDNDIECFIKESNNGIINNHRKSLIIQIDDIKNFMNKFNEIDKKDIENKIQEIINNHKKIINYIEEYDKTNKNCT
jgi:hypothetical protein